MKLMSRHAQRLATFEDLLKLGEDVRAEVIAGELLASPAPLPRHSKAQGAIRRFIGGPYDDDDGHGGPGGWWIFVEVDIRLTTHNIVRPDVAGWRRERLAQPGGVRPIEVIPDWICEIASPSTAARDRVTKRALYARHRVPHYWIVDPEARTLEALILDGDHWTEAGAWDSSAVARIPPFTDVEIEVGRLFLPVEADPVEPE
jgi:Uma2 family endonuclease